MTSALATEVVLDDRRRGGRDGSSPLHPAMPKLPPLPAWLRPRADVALAVLRICAATTMIAAHGWPKLAGWATKSQTFSDPLGIGHAPSLALAICGELVASLFVLVGFQARLAAIPVMSTMAVAAFLQHANDPFGKKELALAYLVVFTVLAIGGAGAWSVDAWRASRRSSGLATLTARSTTRAPPSHTP